MQQNLQRPRTRNTKPRLMNSLIFPIATYAAADVDLKKKTPANLRFRNVDILCIHYPLTNATILEEENIKTKLTKINRNVLRYFDHNCGGKPLCELQ